MNYQRISYFIKAAEVMNFSEAARSMYITPQSFGKQIALLEEELGGKLFERSTRAIRLTEFGRLCYENFSNPMLALERSFGRMCELGRGRQRGIRIGIFSALSRRRVVSPIVTNILGKYTDKDVNISMMSMGDLQSCIRSSKIDLGITVTHDKESGWEGCTVYPMVDYPAQIVVSKNHRCFLQKGMSREDMQSSAFVRMNLPQFSETDYFAEIPCAKKIVVENYETMKLEVDGGRAFAIVAGPVDEVYDQGYKMFELPCHSFLYKLALICNSSVNTPFVEEVCDLIQSTFKA